MFSYSLSNFVVSHPLTEQLGIKFQTSYAIDGLSFSHKVDQLLLACIREYMDIVGLLYSIYHDPKVAEADQRLHLLESLVGGVSGDMQFVVDDNVVSAHSEIVTMWSEPFAKMLQSTMREGLTRKIEIKSEELDSVKALVRYFYTAKIDLNNNNALPLLRLSLLYDIGSLTNLCLAFLIDNICMENCIEVYSFAQLHHEGENATWKSLLDAATDFIKEHTTEIVSSHILHLDSSLLANSWPLLRSIDTKAHQELCASSFLNWATQNWDVSSFSECLGYIETIRSRGDDVSDKCDQDGGEQKECDVPTGEAMEYFHKYCCDVITSNFEDQHRLKKFPALPIQCFVSILKSDDLIVSREYTVLEAIRVWTQADGQKRSIHLPDLLECVQFEYIDITEIVSISATFPQISSWSSFPELLRTALRLKLKAKSARDGVPPEQQIKKRRKLTETPSSVVNTSLPITSSTPSSPVPSSSTLATSPPSSPSSPASPSPFAST